MSVCVRMCGGKRGRGREMPNQWESVGKIQDHETAGPLESRKQEAVVCGWHRECTGS